MKKITLLAVLIIAALSSNANAQTSATVTNTTAGAVLIKALTLAQTSNLHFGSNVLVNALGGTVVLPSNSTVRTYIGGVASSPATPIATNASYDVTGTALETYAITLPSSVVVTNTNSTVTSDNTMDITSMTARFSGKSTDAVTSTLSNAGSDSFTLGASLTVKPNQSAGVYAGNFNVTIDYN